MTKEKYTIQGMTCANCAKHIEKALNKLDGIKEVNINLLLNNMEIEKTDKLSSDTVIQQVRKAGYDATLSNENYILSDKKKTSEAFIRLVISILLLVALVLSNLLIKQQNYITISMQFIATIIIYILSFQRLFKGTRQLIELKPTMDSLIALSCLVSFFYSGYLAIFNSDKTLFLQAGSMVLTFSNIGLYLEAKSKVKTTKTITNLMSLAATSAILFNGNKQETISLDKIKVGDLLLIIPGSKIPTDGIVVSGSSFIDQSSLTGESIPIEKQIDDNVLSGTLNLNGTLVIQATTLANDSTFSKIIDLVQQAANSKAPISKFSDKVSSYFVFFVILISLITFITWLLISKDTFTAWNYAMSVLVVSCPCALALATPTAVMVATGQAAQLGFIYKNAAIIEETSRIDTIVFDKTNTLTAGKPQVDKCVIVNSIDNIYDIVYALEATSEHPLAKAILQYVKPQVKNELQIETTYTIGLGISANYLNHNYYLGNEKLMAKHNIDVSSIMIDDATMTYFAMDNDLVATFSLSDTLKPGIKETIKRLSNYHLVMLTGDNEKAAQLTAQQLGIKEVYSSLLPNDKKEVISKLQQNHHVCMIGDGINDTIALSQANVGIASNNAIDVAIDSSDIYLLNDSVSNIVNIFSLSKYAMRIMRENLLWALAYNSILIPLACGLFSHYSLTLKPVYSALAMSLSSLTVITNALRIYLYKPFNASKK